MSYELGFLDDALKEWRRLDANTRGQFKKKLMERLENPRQSDCLNGLDAAFKLVVGHETGV